jgi:hypothetical protein
VFGYMMYTVIVVAMQYKVSPGVILVNILSCFFVINRHSGGVLGNGDDEYTHMDQLDIVDSVIHWIFSVHMDVWAL